MSSLSVRLRYRPVRFAWIIESGDLEAFRRAVRMSCAIWGGRFCPIIPIDDLDLADALIKLYRVDYLEPASDTEAVRAFIKRYPHIRKPPQIGSFFVQGANGRRKPTLLDVKRPIDEIHKEFFYRVDEPDISFTQLGWSNEDPLTDAFLVMYGDFPSPDLADTDYSYWMRSELRANRFTIRADGRVPEPGRRFGVVSLSAWNLGKDRSIRNFHDAPGFYIGEAANFSDLVHCWNLGAAGIRLAFFDPSHSARMEEMKVDFARSSSQRVWATDPEPRLSIWGRPEMHADAIRAQWLPGMQALGQTLLLHVLDDGTWNGLNLKVPEVFISKASTLAATGEVGGKVSLTFPLPGRPEDDDYLSNQTYVVSVSTDIGLLGNEHITLEAPYLPEINAFYGRNFTHHGDATRSEPGGIGVITSTWVDNLTIRGMDVTELASAIFKSVGIEAKPSKPGLVATSLIRQLGGLDGCRPFKIAGVRHLIESHKPDQDFSRSDAMQTIFGQGAIRPLSDYQWLYIEQRPLGTSLTNEAVLGYLLDRGVFRPGLKIGCPNCQLQFWKTLDEAGVQMECEYCGYLVKTSRQLKDKGWAFRRSGLFGRDDNQEGAIPVALALQQLTGLYGFSEGFYTTAQFLEPITAAIPNCETDFIVVNQHDGRIQIVIGECKTRKPITEGDVDNLTAVANAFPSDRFDVYVVFAKLGDFEAEEVNWIRKLNGAGRQRAIILTERELEPGFVYERTAELFEIESSAVSLDDMARVTDAVFFQNRLRPKA